jgi:hypothetical protein
LISERLIDNGVTDWDAAFVCRAVVEAEADDELMDLQYVRMQRAVRVQGEEQVDVCAHRSVRILV